MVLQSKNEETGQYGKRLCIRVEGIPTTDKEKLQEFLNKLQ